MTAVSQSHSCQEGEDYVRSIGIEKTFKIVVHGVSGQHKLIQEFSVEYTLILNPDVWAPSVSGQFLLKEPSGAVRSRRRTLPEGGLPQGMAPKPCPLQAGPSAVFFGGSVVFAQSAGWCPAALPSRPCRLGRDGIHGRLGHGGLKDPLAMNA